MTINARELVDTFGGSIEQVLDALAPFAGTMPEGPGIELIVELIQMKFDENKRAAEAAGKNGPFPGLVNRRDFDKGLETAFRCVLNRDDYSHVTLSDRHFDWLVGLGCFVMMEPAYSEKVIARFTPERAYRFCRAVDVSRDSFPRFLSLMHHLLGDEQLKEILWHWIKETNRPMFAYGREEKSLTVSHNTDAMIDRLSRAGRDFGEDLYRLMWEKGKWRYQRALKTNPRLPADIVADYVLHYAIRKQNHEGELTDSEVYTDLLQNPAMDSETMLFMAGDKSTWYNLALNPGLIPELVTIFTNGADTNVKVALLQNPSFRKHPAFEQVLEEAIDAKEDWYLFSAMTDEFAKALIFTPMRPKLLFKLADYEFRSASAKNARPRDTIFRSVYYFMVAQDDGTKWDLMSSLMQRPFAHEAMEGVLMNPEVTLPEMVIEDLYRRLSGGAESVRSLRIAIAANPITPLRILKDIINRYKKSWPPLAEKAEANVEKRGLSLAKK